MVETGADITMEHYKKGEVLELDVDLAAKFNDLIKDDVVAMRVKNASRVRNLIGFAVKRLKEDVIRQMTFTGTGPAVSKTVTCAEITKRKFKNLHQITKLFRKQIEEYWEPIEEGLDRLKVTRSVPGICILLSKDPLDTSQPGYQPPGVYDALWATSGTNEKRRKHPGKNRKRQFNEKQKVGHRNEDTYTSVKKDQKPRSNTASPGIRTVQKTKRTKEIKSDPLQKVGELSGSKSDERKSCQLDKVGEPKEMKKKESETRSDLIQKVGVPSESQIGEGRKSEPFQKVEEPSESQKAEDGRTSCPLQKAEESNGKNAPT